MSCVIIFFLSPFIALLNSKGGNICVNLVAGICLVLVFETLCSACIFSISHVVMWYFAKRCNRLYNSKSEWSVDFLTLC